ncbi:MAG: flagellar motor protein MotB [Gammaproteobacteria bacterium]|nr:flagellar motor protein MotB [Gammaproteobacteria bacterium]
MPATTPWYGWDTEEPDNGWLLTYVDVLSVILAMLVILLGRMAVEQIPSTSGPEAIVSAADTSPATVSAVVRDDYQPKSSPPPELEPVRREQRISELVEQRFQGEVVVVPREHGVSIQIPDVVLFESAGAGLQASARSMLTRLAMTLLEIGDADIAVEGHTDDRPVRGGAFNSNWELAAARANTVTQFLLARGFAAHRLRAVSYGDSRPVGDNSSVEGQAANRRVELRVEFPDPPEKHEAGAAKVRLSGGESWLK